MLEKIIPVALLATACASDPVVDKSLLKTHDECLSRENYPVAGCIVNPEGLNIGLENFDTFGNLQKTQAVHRQKQYDWARSHYPAWTVPLNLMDSVEGVATDWALNSLSDYTVERGFTPFDIDQNGRIDAGDDLNWDRLITKEDLLIYEEIK